MTQKYIKLPSQEYLKECFDYDSETGNLTWKERPLHHFKNKNTMKSMNTKHSGFIAGSISNGRYLSVIINLKSYRNHRIIWKLVYGADPFEQIDHIDGNKFNNKINNLREATNSENQHNEGLRKTNTSGFKGVSFDKWFGLWVAHIGLNNKQIKLGRFKNKEDAIEAVISARVSYHKEFTNFGVASV